jgi:hypothetical protein
MSIVKAIIGVLVIGWGGLLLFFGLVRASAGNGTALASGRTWRTLRQPARAWSSFSLSRQLFHHGATLHERQERDGRDHACLRAPTRPRSVSRRLRAVKKALSASISCVQPRSARAARTWRVMIIYDHRHRQRAKRQRSMEYFWIRPDGPELFPLNCPGRLAGHVVHYPVHALHLVDDARRGLAQEFHIELVEVRGHAVG